MPHLIDESGLEARAGGLDLPAVDPARLLAELRRVTGRPGLAFAEPPHRIGSGGEAVVEAFRLAGAPSPFAGPLVLRRLLALKEPGQVHREAVIHAALVEQGFPVPRVLHADMAAEVLGAPYLVADRVPGEVLLQEVTRPSTLARHPARLPRIVYQALAIVPALLGELQAELHQLDPEPLRKRLAELGEEAAFDDRLARLEALVDRHALEGLRPGLVWLRTERPSAAPAVICHGDFVFTNVCVERGRVTGVFDWSNLALAEPAYDVAASLARIESHVPGLPPLLARVSRVVQAGLARRTLAAYRRRGALDPARLRYHEAYWRRSAPIASTRRRIGGCSRRCRPAGGSSPPRPVPAPARGPRSGRRRPRRRTRSAPGCR